MRAVAFRVKITTLSYRTEKGGAPKVQGVGQECPTHTGKKSPHPLLKAVKGREPHFVILNRYVVTCYVTESAASY